MEPFCPMLYQIIRRARPYSLIQSIYSNEIDMIKSIINVMILFNGQGLHRVQVLQT